MMGSPQCGDVPDDLVIVLFIFLCSPHCGDVPATRMTRSPSLLCSPHCGDVPFRKCAEAAWFRCSPRTWGCTPNCLVKAFRGVKFPHNVGMVLSLFSRTCARCNVPHTAWGCPVTGGTTGLAVTVFPTTWGEQKTILQRSRV